MNKHKKYLLIIATFISFSIPTPYIYAVTDSIFIKEQTLKEVTIRAKSQIERINESAYNALAIDTKNLHNVNSELSQALAKAPGMKIREAGGVGSDMRLMMDGFSGKHIKVFIDGIPQEGVGGSFSLNNIPINFAERIEVYRGVVPVGFGSDALAGVINVVTNKNRKRWFIDAAYSYGSFNTHKTYVNFGQTLNSGLTYEVNAFQNYSDNNYKIDVAVEEFRGPNANDGSSLNSKDIQTVERFHDTYHNETVIGKVGIIGKSWVDRLMLVINYSQYYKEIQNGVIQKVVFGDKHRKGNSIIPSLEYRKRDLFTDGLNIMFTTNYNYNTVNNVDTASFKYNWRGEKQKSSAGETSYLDTKSKNNNWNATFTADYRLGDIHTITFNHVINSFKRTNTGTSGASNSNLANAIPKITRKNIGGLSYLLTPSKIWNVSVFGKYYNQYGEGPLATDANSTNYIKSTNSVNAFGYGAAGTYSFFEMFQTKLSYEKAYRLPTNEEMFGDEDMEKGDFSLKPENSDNINISLNISKQLGKHSVLLEGGLVYRNAKNYIQRTINLGTKASTIYGTYQNHGKVETKGYNISLHYNYGGIISINGNITRMDARDNVKTIEQGSSQLSNTYGARMRNTPYLFADSDISFYLYNIGKKGNVLTFRYDNFYTHSFPLYYENLGARDKKIVDTQFANNLSLVYSMENGKYNVSFECKNFTNAKLYDNYGLQKAGRAFYGKLRVFFGA